MTWTPELQEMHDNIVHFLRCVGWSKEDAIYRADEITARLSAPPESPRHD